MISEDYVEIKSISNLEMQSPFILEDSAASTDAFLCEYSY